MRVVSDSNITLFLDLQGLSLLPFLSYTQAHGNTKLRLCLNLMNLMILIENGDCQ